MASDGPSIDCTFKDCVTPGLKRPHDVIYHMGRYIVTDTHGNRVISIHPGDSSSKDICKGKQGLLRTCPNMEPHSIIALTDSTHEFLFTDRKNCCIVHISGDTCCVWNQEHSHLFERPTGIAVNKYRDIYVADSKKHCIFLFNEFGKLCTTFGENDLKCPWFVVLNSRDQLHVSDGDHGIKIFEKSDDKSAYQLIRTIVVNTDNARWTCRGIDIDKYDNIFVTVRTVRSVGRLSYEKVTIYNRDYEPVANFGGYMQFGYIRGLCFDYDRNFIVVVDGEGNRLQRYKLYGDRQPLQPASDTNSMTDEFDQDRVSLPPSARDTNSTVHGSVSGQKSAGADSLPSYDKYHYAKTDDGDEPLSDDVDDDEGKSDNAYNREMSLDDGPELEFDDSELIAPKAEYYHLVPDK